jgi:hypothetical protein
MSKGLVYFIGASNGAEAMVKIGFTKGDPTDRLRNLQCGSPLRLGIFTAFPGSQETERLLHKTFAPLRIHGEWFQVKLKLLDFLVVLMQDALTRRPADPVHVLEAVEIVVLADKPIKDSDDPEEYLASADTAPWEWMRQALAEADAEEATIQ